MCKLNGCFYATLAFYLILMILELASASFIINNIDKLLNFIKHNETFIKDCDSDGLNSFDHGTLYNNTIVLLVALFLLLIMMIIKLIYEIKNNRHDESDGLINNFNESIRFLRNIANKSREAFSIPLISLCIICYVLNITQFIFQLYNVNMDCVELINSEITNFSTMYNILQCSSAVAVLSAIFACQMGICQ